MMLVLALLVIVLTAVGWGVEGGFSGLVDNLREQDPVLVALINPNTAPFHSCGRSLSSSSRICLWACYRT